MLYNSVCVCKIYLVALSYEYFMYGKFNCNSCCMCKSKYKHFGNVCAVRITFINVYDTHTSAYLLLLFVSFKTYSNSLALYVCVCVCKMLLVLENIWSLKKRILTYHSVNKLYIFRYNKYSLKINKQKNTPYIIHTKLNIQNKFCECGGGNQ